MFQLLKSSGYFCSQFVLHSVERLYVELHYPAYIYALGYLHWLAIGWDLKDVFWVAIGWDVEALFWVAIGWNVQAVFWVSKYQIYIVIGKDPW